MERKLVFQGHTFSDEKQLIEAKKEAEAVEYLRAKTDFNNAAMLMKLYNRLLEREMMETVIGLDFLAEIRGRLLQSGVFKEEQVKPLPELKTNTKKRGRTLKEKRHLEIDRLRAQNAVLKIVCVFLVLLVGGMFFIALTGKQSPLASRYELRIQDKYAAWAQELAEKETRLQEIAEQLREQGIELPEELTWEEGTDGEGKNIGSR